MKKASNALCLIGRSLKTIPKKTKKTKNKKNKQTKKNNNYDS